MRSEIHRNEMQEKTKVENVDYFYMKERGWAYHVGIGIVDYTFLEDFVVNLEKKYGVIIKGIGYDRWNAASSVGKWSKEGYTTIMIGQNGNTLHSTNKKIKESVLTQRWKYEENDLLEINFKNVRVVYDSNLKSFLNKKKSVGKIDMVASTLNATNLWVSDIEDENITSVYEERGLISF